MDGDDDDGRIGRVECATAEWAAGWRFFFFVSWTARL